jgi:FkbM family methyltransferase
MKKLVFDIGMHVGNDTNYYLKKGFKVVAVEANKNLVAKANARFQEDISNNDLTIIDKAISEINSGEIDFYINNTKDDWGTIFPEWNRSLNNDFSKIKVETVSLKDIIDEHGMPYYIKIDIEGADIICLKSLNGYKELPKFISIELPTPNNFKNKNENPLEIITLLSELGYKKFKISDQSINWSKKNMNPPKEGTFVNIKFDGHSSGPFGNELEGKFYSLDEISAAFLKNYYNPSPFDIFYEFKIKLNYYLKMNLFKMENKFHKNGWFDLHAYLD